MARFLASRSKCEQLRGSGAPGDNPAIRRLSTKWLNLDFVEVVHDGKVMRFSAAALSNYKRARSLLTKEPITIAWIDSFEPGDVFYDIGANVGTYSVYAAVMRGADVIAFEPEALNLAELNKNLFLNSLQGQAIAYGIALSEVDKTDRLLLSEFAPGLSYHDFQENSWLEDKEFGPDWRVSKAGRLEQGCIGRRLDSLISDGLAAPTHIKIDVDGLEHRVIAGMTETLARADLRTVLVEVNFDEPRNLAAIERLEENGWRYSWDQLRTHRSARLSVEQIKRFQGRKQGGLNYVLYRDEFYDEYFRRVFEAYTPGEYEVSTHQAGTDPSS